MSQLRPDHPGPPTRQRAAALPCGPHPQCSARVSCSGRCWTGCSTGCSGCWTAGNHHYGRAHKPNASIARARRVARGRPARPARWRLTAWLSSWAVQFISTDLYNSLASSFLPSCSSKSAVLLISCIASSESEGVSISSSKNTQASGAGSSLPNRGEDVSALQRINVQNSKCTI